MRVPLTVVHLNAARFDSVDIATARLPFTIGDRPMELDITVPAGENPPTQLLPIYQGLANLVVDAAVDKVAQFGKTVSCRKGCGACCRQPVPISETEALAIAQLVDELPESRKSDVRARFEDARYRLAKAGLLDRYEHPERLTSVEIMALAANYFALGIPCPFLEDESCSIHPDRPLACREYLVTSPAENCARPGETLIEPVPITTRVAAAVRAGDRGKANDRTGWVLLSLAPHWAENHPIQDVRPGPELLQEFFDRLFTRSDWVHEANLRPFLTAVGWALGAEFNAGDWLSVENGIPETNELENRWFEFAYACQQSAHLRLARGANNIVRFQTKLPDEALSRTRLAATMCQQFELVSRPKP